jgi:hypothetical protein
MGVLTNCTITSEEVVGDTNFPSTTLVISPNEGYTIAAQAVLIQDVSYATNSNSLVYTDGSTVVFPRVSNNVGSIVTNVTLSDVDGKVNVLVNIADAYAITADTPLPIDVTATATAVTNYGLVRPAIIENATQALTSTTVTMANNSGVSVLTEKPNVNNVDTHYFNSEVPFDTWTKIGAVTVNATSNHTIVYPPYLVSNGSEEGLSKFDLIQTSVTEDAATGIISNYVFDLMFKDTGATGFVWPSTWLASAITDPEMSAVLSVKTVLVTVPTYTHVVDGVDLGGGIDGVVSSSDMIPSGGTPSDELVDLLVEGDEGATFGVGVAEVGGGDATAAVVGTGSPTYTIDASGLQNIPLTFSSNQTGSTKQYDVTISGTGTTAILSQVRKTSGGAAYTPYSGGNTSSAVNRYKQLGNANVSIITEGGGTNWTRDGGNVNKTKTAAPLSSNSDKDTFTFVRDRGANIKTKSGSPTTFDTTNSKGAVVSIKNLSTSVNGTDGTITGDIFYEKIGYETITFTLDFNDWFELVVSP